MSSRALSYVKSIIKYCQDAIAIRESFGNSYEKFLQEINSQYSISFCIEQIGELAKKLRDDAEGYADKYPVVPWNKIAGTRNKIAHGYDAIDLELVYSICAKDLPELLTNCTYILQQEQPLADKIYEANKLHSEAPQQPPSSKKQIETLIEK